MQRNFTLSQVSFFSKRLNGCTELKLIDHILHVPKRKRRVCCAVWIADENRLPLGKQFAPQRDGLFDHLENPLFRASPFLRQVRNGPVTRLKLRDNSEDFILVEVRKP